MKLIRKYFLLMSYAPFVISAVAFIVIMVGIIIWGGINGPNEYDFHKLTGWLILGLAVITVANIILTYNVRDKYITFHDDEENYWRLILITDNDERIIVENPIWKKGKEYFLLKPYDYHSKSDLETSAVTDIQGKYKNTTLTIPVTITLVLDKKFDELELFNLLHNYFPENKKLSIRDYIQDVLRKFNVDNQDNINEIMSRYARKLISEPELLNEIVENLIFPERLFENVIDTKTCVKEVTFSSCKGMTCEPVKPGKIITVEN